MYSVNSWPCTNFNCWNRLQVLWHKGKIFGNNKGCRILLKERTKWWFITLMQTQFYCLMELFLFLSLGNLERWILCIFRSFKHDVRWWIFKNKLWLTQLCCTRSNFRKVVFDTSSQPSIFVIIFFYMVLALNYWPFPNGNLQTVVHWKWDIKKVSLL